MDLEIVREYLMARNLVKNDADWEDARFFINSIGHENETDAVEFAAKVAAAMRAEQSFQSHIKTERGRMSGIQH